MQKIKNLIAKFVITYFYDEIVEELSKQSEEELQKNETARLSRALEKSRTKAEKVFEKEEITIPF